MKFIAFARRRVSHRRVAHPPIRSRLKLQTPEPRHLQSPAIERCNCIYADAKERMSPCLIDGNNARIDFYHIEQKLLVTHAAELVFLLLGGQAREIVLFGGFKPPHIASNFGGYWNSFRRSHVAVEDFGGEKTSGLSLHKLVAAKCFFVEEKAIGQIFVHTGDIAFFGQRGGVNAKIVHRFVSHLAVRKRRLNGPCAAVAKQQPAAGTKLIALGVAAEIIVIVENENAGVGFLCTPEIGCREPTDSSANDDQVI